jgi:hypothetical protein
MPTNRGITHVMKNPVGHQPGWNYSLTGTVPLALMDGRKPTRHDVMGGRVAPDGLAYHGRKWQSIAEIREAARETGVRLCTTPGCACRKLF